MKVWFVSIIQGSKITGDYISAATAAGAEAQMREKYGSLIGPKTTVIAEEVKV